MKLTQAIPAMPVRDIERSIGFYRDKLGLTLGYSNHGFAKLLKDDIEIHLWAASDESWQGRAVNQPIVSGAESFIAGTASCRIGVEGVDELHGVLEPLGILHWNARLRDTDYGTREFGVLDPDGNLVTFFERKSPA